MSSLFHAAVIHDSICSHHDSIRKLNISKHLCSRSQINVIADSRRFSSVCTDAYSGMNPAVLPHRAPRVDNDRSKMRYGKSLSQNIQRNGKSIPCLNPKKPQQIIVPVPPVRVECIFRKAEISGMLIQNLILRQIPRQTIIPFILINRSLRLQNSFQLIFTLYLH